MQKKLLQQFGETEAQSLNYQLTTIIDAARETVAPLQTQVNRLEFLRVTAKLDELRDEKFLDIFPELSSLFSKSPASN